MSWVFLDCIWIYVYIWPISMGRGYCLAPLQLFWIAGYLRNHDLLPVVLIVFMAFPWEVDHSAQSLLPNGPNVRASANPGETFTSSLCPLWIVLRDWAHSGTLVCLLDECFTRQSCKGLSGSISVLTVKSHSEPGARSHPQTSLPQCPDRMSFPQVIWYGGTCRISSVLIL